MAQNDVPDFTILTTVHGATWHVRTEAVIHAYRDPNDGKDTMVCTREGGRCVVLEPIESVAAAIPNLSLLLDRNGGKHLVDLNRIVSIIEHPLDGGTVVAIQGGDGLIVSAPADEILARCRERAEPGLAAGSKLVN